jgi:CRISPR-associated protein Csm3
MRKNLELQWTEVKMETSINRLTGTAQHGSLRQIERVPAGAVFKDAQFILNVFEKEDKALLKNLFIALELVENDYLGGMGSRGYGRVSFQSMTVFWNSRESYINGEVSLDPARKINDGLDTPALLVKNFDEVLQRMN